MTEEDNHPSNDVIDNNNIQTSLSSSSSELSSLYFFNINDGESGNSLCEQEEDDHGQAEEEDTTNSLISCISSKAFCRPDDIGKYLEYQHSSSSSSSSSLLPPPLIHAPKSSIPSHRRIPSSMANNRTFILSRRNDLPSNGTATALQEYNPTLLPLYKTKTTTTLLPNGTTLTTTSINENYIDNTLLDYITGKYHPHFTNKDVDQVKYISMERLTNHHSCDQEASNTSSSSSSSPQNYNSSLFATAVAESCYYAFSLLDEQLQVIPNTELIVDLDYYIFWKFVVERGEKPPGSKCLTNDGTIFVSRTTKSNPKKDQLFLIIRSATEGSILLPIDLRRTPYFMNNTKGWDTKLYGMPLTADMYDDGTLYGKGMQLRLIDDGKWKNRGPNKNSMRHYIRFHGGYINFRQNNHIFDDIILIPEDESSTSEEEEGKGGGNEGHNTWLETHVADSHVSYSLDLFFEKGLKSLRDVNFFPNSTVSQDLKKKNRHYYPNATRYISYHKKQKSFQTLSDNQMQHLGHRGTACCVDIDLFSDKEQRHMPMKVGIGQSVTKERRSYFSYFYAFLPRPPFPIVALSGYFCLGGMKATDRNLGTHWMSHQDGIFNASMHVLNETYSCPQMTFVSSFMEKVDDPNILVISYGVNDCFSRSILVPKEKIQILLQPEAFLSTSWSRKRRKTKNGRKGFLQSLFTLAKIILSFYFYS